MTTEQGSDQWEYNAQSFSWKAELKRAKGSRTADLFLEPGHDDASQTYHILIRYEGGATRELAVRGRKVNRGLRMPGAAIAGPVGGAGPARPRGRRGPRSVPTGSRTRGSALAGVSTKVRRQGDAHRGRRGERSGSREPTRSSCPTRNTGRTPRSPARADLFFQPGRDLKGQKLNVRVLYANETMDSAAWPSGRVIPSSGCPSSRCRGSAEVSASARWHGQDGQDVTGPGDVHVTVSGLGRHAGDRGRRADRLGARDLDLSERRPDQGGESRTGDVDRPARPQARPGSHLDRALLRPLPRRDEGDDDAPPASSRTAG